MTANAAPQGKHRVLVNVMESDWSLHFIGPDGHTRVGPWLLLESHDEVGDILRWGNISEAELTEHETNIPIRTEGEVLSSDAVMASNARPRRGAIPRTEK
jgi:hypothetical protein